MGIPCKMNGPTDFKRLVSFLERQEQYIYWLQTASGQIQDQVASLCVNGKFYALNLKLEKAIFRQFRLNKNFVNVETLEDGTKKLRIPHRLFSEKIKTSKKHLVSGVTCVCRFIVY